jgi:uncharacterized protein YjbI with pentapeptide repeats
MIANLENADLENANLRYTNLENANLENVDLANSNLENVNLENANLKNANLTNSNLTNVNLNGAKLPDFLIVPESGSFVFYKKVIDQNGNEFVLECFASETAKRINAIGHRKIRVSQLKVQKIMDLKGLNISESMKDVEFIGINQKTTKYRLNEIVDCDSFDDDIRNVCTNGLHGFMTFDEAERCWLC